MKRKLFLTSAGLPKETKEYFIQLLQKEIKNTKVAFIPTAAHPEPDKWYVKQSINELKEIGFKNIEEIDLKNENKNSLLNKLKIYDVIYVSGGNTFYLLDWVRKSGFDKIIPKLLDAGKIYIGVSAGSIIAGPNIELAGWKYVDTDKNIVGLKNLTGLNLVPFAAFVHYEKKYKMLVEKEIKKVNYPVFLLNDKQAVLCINGKYKIVGDL